MALAKVVDLATDTDKAVILNVRAGVVQPFVAPDWLDLRVGFLLSLTKADDDDDTTDLDESIVEGGGVLPEDRFWIGVKDNSTVLPHNNGTVFIGFSNVGIGDQGPETRGDSELVSSDAAIGTTNANFWRPNVSWVGRDYPNLSGVITNGSVAQARSRDGIQQHFAQDASGAGGYATLLTLRLQRADARNHAKIITATSKQGTHNGVVLMTNTPTEALLQTNLESFPGTVQQWGPVTLSAVPDSLYLYWPFHDSRLRLHAMGILKVR